MKNPFSNAAHAVITKLLRRANERIDIPSVRRTYNATRALITEVRVSGTAYRQWLQITYAGLITVPMPHTQMTFGDKTWNGNNLLEVCGYSTIVNLIRGKILRKNLNTGKEYWEDYTPESAYFLGHIRTYGDGASNEALRFILNVWPEIRAKLQKDLGILGGS